MPLLDLLAPVVCVACGAGSDGDLCAACAGLVEPLRPPLCDRCGMPSGVRAEGCRACVALGGFTRARSLVRYEGPARRLTIALKRRGRPALAAALGELMAGVVRSQGLAGAAVCCVPAGSRATGKGFDHAELLARAVARGLGSGFGRWVYRAADAGRQSDSPAGGRRANATGSFRASRSVPSEVLLVDDVMTTGATAEACARELVRAGARRVDVVTFARSIRRDWGPPRVAILGP